MQNQYLIEPFTYQMQFSFRNTYDPAYDSYKYKVAIGIEKIRLNLSPDKCYEMMLQSWFAEAHSYQYELKRFRPLIRI